MPAQLEVCDARPMGRLTGYKALALPGYNVLYNRLPRSDQLILIDEATRVEVFKDGLLIGAYWGLYIDPDCPPEGLLKR